MAWAKELGEFVTIQFDDMEVAGKFGADGIIDGKLPNGEAYKWKKRRMLSTINGSLPPK